MGWDVVEVSFISLYCILESVLRVETYGSLRAGMLSPLKFRSYYNSLN